MIRHQFSNVRRAALARKLNWNAAIRLGQVSPDGRWIDLPDDFIVPDVPRPEVKPEPPLPSLPRMALNAAGAAGRASFAALRGKPVFVPDEVEAIRLALCHVCPHWRQTDRRCALCGCFTEAVFARKAKMATKRFPLGKWGRYAVAEAAELRPI